MNPPKKLLKCIKKIIKTNQELFAMYVKLVKMIAIYLRKKKQLMSFVLMIKFNFTFPII